MSKEHWWTYHWDVIDHDNVKIPYDRLTRWRRWLVTVYRFEGYGSVTWEIVFPGNLMIGISL